MLLQKIAEFINFIYSTPIKCAQSSIAFFFTVYLTSWAIFDSCGAHGGGRTTFFLLFISTLATVFLVATTLLRLVIIRMLLKDNLDKITKGIAPELIIGIGPGGSIIAGILAKLSADKYEKEPYIFILNRRFILTEDFSDRELVNIATLNELGINKMRFILLVTPEINTGLTFKHADRYLRKIIDPINVIYKTFSVITSSKAGLQDHFTLLKSEYRGLLPWQDSPDRIK